MLEVPAWAVFLTGAILWIVLIRITFKKGNN